MTIAYRCSRCGEHVELEHYPTKGRELMLLDHHWCSQCITEVYGQGQEP